MTDILLFPFGGNARESVLSIIEQNKINATWRILGFIDENEDTWGLEFYGLKVIGGLDVIADIPSSKILAVPGNPTNFQHRSKIISKLNVPSERFATIIDPSSRIAPDAMIGMNSLIMANVTISCSVVIGDHCVILPHTVISHDSAIGNYTLIGSNVSISGSCTVGHSCYIGTGSKIKEGVIIGPQSLVGLGACVVCDVKERTVVTGNPARFLRNVNG